MTDVCCSLIEYWSDNNHITLINALLKSTLGADQMWYDLADNVRSSFLLQYTTFSVEKPKDSFFAREEKHFIKMFFDRFENISWNWLAITTPIYWSSVHHIALWKNEKFSLTEKIFRQINFLVICLVKTLLSRNFCQEMRKKEENWMHKNSVKSTFSLTQCGKVH